MNSYFDNLESTKDYLSKLQKKSHTTKKNSNVRHHGLNVDVNSLWKGFTSIKLPSFLEAQIASMDMDKDVSLRGIFNEIRRIWITVNNKLYLWNYYGDEINEYVAANPIVSVGVVKPKEGIFRFDISHVLVVTTAVQVTIIPINWDIEKNTLRMYTSKFLCVTNNTLMVRVVSHQESRRIFLISENAAVYELIYDLVSPLVASLWIGGGRWKKKQRCYIIPVFNSFSLNIYSAVRGLYLSLADSGFSSYIKSGLEIMGSNVYSQVVDATLNERQKLLIAMDNINVLHIFDITGKCGDVIRKVAQTEIVSIKTERVMDIHVVEVAEGMEDVPSTSIHCVGESGAQYEVIYSIEDVEYANHTTTTRRLTLTSLSTLTPSSASSMFSVCKSYISRDVNISGWIVESDKVEDREPRAMTNAQAFVSTTRRIPVKQQKRNGFPMVTLDVQSDINVPPSSDLSLHPRERIYEIKEDIFRHQEYIYESRNVRVGMKRKALRQYDGSHYNYNYNNNNNINHNVGDSKRLKLLSGEKAYNNANSGGIIRQTQHKMRSDLDIQHNKHGRRLVFLQRHHVHLWDMKHPIDFLKQAMMTYLNDTSNRPEDEKLERVAGKEIQKHCVLTVGGLSRVYGSVEICCMLMTLIASNVETRDGFNSKLPRYYNLICKLLFQKYGQEGQDNAFRKDLVNLSQAPNRSLHSRHKSHVKSIQYIRTPHHDGVLMCISRILEEYWNYPVFSPGSASKGIDLTHLPQFRGDSAKGVALHPSNITFTLNELMQRREPLIALLDFFGKNQTMYSLQRQRGSYPPQNHHSLGVSHRYYTAPVYLEPIFTDSSQGKDNFYNDTYFSTSFQFSEFDSPSDITEKIKELSMKEEKKSLFYIAEIVRRSVEVLDLLIALFKSNIDLNVFLNRYNVNDITIRKLVVDPFGDDFIRNLIFHIAPSKSNVAGNGIFNTITNTCPTYFNKGDWKIFQGIQLLSDMKADPNKVKMTNLNEFIVKSEDLICDGGHFLLESNLMNGCRLDYYRNRILSLETMISKKIFIHMCLELAGHSNSVGIDQYRLSQLPRHDIRFIVYNNIVKLLSDGSLSREDQNVLVRHTLKHRHRGLHEMIYNVLLDVEPGSISDEEMKKRLDLLGETANPEFLRDYLQSTNDDNNSNNNNMNDSGRNKSGTGSDKDISRSGGLSSPHSGGTKHIDVSSNSHPYQCQLSSIEQKKLYLASCESSGKLKEAAKLAEDIALSHEILDVDHRIHLLEKSIRIYNKLNYTILILNMNTDLDLLRIQLDVYNLVSTLHRSNDPICTSDEYSTILNDLKLKRIGPLKLYRYYCRRFNLHSCSIRLLHNAKLGDRVAIEVDWLSVLDMNGRRDAIALTLLRDELVKLGRYFVARPHRNVAAAADINRHPWFPLKFIVTELFYILLQFNKDMVRDQEAGGTLKDPSFIPALLRECGISNKDIYVTLNDLMTTEDPLTCDLYPLRDVYPMLFWHCTTWADEYSSMRCVNGGVIGTLQNILELYIKPFINESNRILESRYEFEAIDMSQTCSELTALHGIWQHKVNIGKHLGGALQRY